MQTETKAGWRTTEFWLVLLSNLLINLGAVDVGGAKYRGLFAILTVLGYALSRGLAKQGVPNGVSDVDGLPHHPMADAADVQPDQGDKGRL